MSSHKNYFFTRNKTEKSSQQMSFNWYTVKPDRCSSEIIKMTLKQSQRGGALLQLTLKDMLICSTLHQVTVTNIVSTEGFFF